jgi:sterol desaturase/sphingolipid hydroxylase (fatty acid hydroxylase superfamily)
MSLGQTLFHRYLGHSRLGGKFFTNHIQFHHGHYSGDHVVSNRYLDDGDNNTLFFILPVALIIVMSYLLLRLDLFIVQAAVMALSFCGHYYLDNQYHVMGSWLCRFAWFRRKQQLHFVHHRQADSNFAVIDYFWDRLLGTYRSSEGQETRRGVDGEIAADPLCAVQSISVLGRLPHGRPQPVDAPALLMDESYHHAGPQDSNA